MLTAGAALWVALGGVASLIARQARREVLELREDVEQLHQLHHKARRRENVGKAREVKEENGDAEEQLVLALAGAAKGNKGPQLVHSAPSPDEERMAARRELQARGAL